MLCQNCNHMEAELTISVSYREQPQWEMHLCPRCAAQIQQLTQAAMAEMRQRTAAGGHPRTAQIPLSPQNGQEMVPAYAQAGELSEEAAAELRVRRQRNELEALLREAVEEENYEEAARLRDALKEHDKGVICHD